MIALPDSEGHAENQMRQYILKQCIALLLLLVKEHYKLILAFQENRSVHLHY